MDLLPTLEASWRSQQQKICVIGAGPAGLAALKLIKDSPQYKGGSWTATAFEARDGVGGVWLPAPPTQNPPLTPLYDSLTTNLPHPVMAYTSLSFPPSTAAYPPASSVLSYLQGYAEHFGLMELVQLNTSVTSVTRDHSTGKWVVTVRKSKQESEETSSFDFLVVANGHYRVPRTPSTPGLQQWFDVKRAMHSVYYRHPSDFGDARTVLVVGAGPSGSDLCSDLLTSGRSVVHSVTNAKSSDDPDGRLKTRGRVASYGDPEKGELTFEDGSTLSGVDFSVLATGYKFDFPFLPESILHRLVPPAVPPLPGILFNSTYSVFPLAKHIFPLVGADEFPGTSVAFLGLPIRVAPLPLLEAQMAAVLHVFAYPTALDATQEALDIVERYETIRAHLSRPAASEPDLTAPNASADPTELAIAAAWHRFDGHEQFTYRDALHVFAGSPVRVAPWEIESYDAKGELRAEWRALERAGEADEWVRGVGAGPGGDAEWVDLLRRLLKRVRDRQEEEKGKSRL
ncbi:FAD/NAD(P)-binding domain-containing protein [Epithele typhae]|uniref:FAD/NAD(P)-binding domain-containing protein n=1 Tax=Epithele typhae TaxID=378194 RepID=UPI002008D3C8|nr:FAD/NAD(P)-binding domain-containing protein [Epithele typhae]KAH9941603.1 FAD/NAD(P)-binding domain-containing protein [Epithele typhae]